MLYGTFASTHFLARVMISARVVWGALTSLAGSMGGPLRPCSRARGPCGVATSLPAETPGPGGTCGAANAGATCPAPRAADAAAATITARRAAGCRTAREYGR